MSKKTTKTKSAHAYYDMHMILKFLRSDVGTNKTLQLYEERFGSIPEDLNVEDMPFYKNFLSKFDTEKAFPGLKLKWNKSDFVSERDCDLLQHLVFASQYVDYKLDYNKDEQTYTLTVISYTVGRPLHTLMFVEVGQLFRIFIDEMLMMELARANSDEGKQYVERHIENRLKHFEQLAEQLRNEMQGIESNIYLLPMPMVDTHGYVEVTGAVERPIPDTYYKVINGKGVIPLNVRSVPSWAFSQADDLVSVFIPASAKRIGTHAFYECKALTTVVIPPDSVRMIGTMAFGFCTSLKRITLPDSLERICEEAFYQCQSLEFVSIPSSVTKIMPYTFCNCQNLKHVDIPDSVTQIGDGAFDGCVNLQSVTIPNSVTRIGKRAFKQCCSLTSVEIPDSVTEISALAFYRCENLEAIVIPDSVKKIGLMAFDECLSLDRIFIRDASVLKSAYVPEGVEIVKTW